MDKLRPYQTTFYTPDDDFNDTAVAFAALLKIDRCAMEADEDHVACEDGFIVPNIELFDAPLFENKEDSNSMHIFTARRNKVKATYNDSAFGGTIIQLVDENDAQPKLSVPLSCGGSESNTIFMAYNTFYTTVNENKTFQSGQGFSDSHQKMNYT